MSRPLLLALFSLPLAVGCVAERNYDNLNVDGFEVMRDLAPGQVALPGATLDGDIGPIDGLEGAGFGSEYSDGYSRTIQVDSETSRGTAFVLFWINDAQAFGDLQPGVTHTFTAADQSVVGGAGCSDTYAGDHYDATAEEIALTLNPVDEDTVEVDYVVWSQEGDLSGSALGTSVSGSFQMEKNPSATGR